MKTYTVTEIEKEDWDNLDMMTPEEAIKIAKTEGYLKGKADADKFLKEWKEDIVNSLAKFDANSVEEVYRYGIARGRIIERENIFEWLKTKDVRLKDVYMYEMKEGNNV